MRRARVLPGAGAEALREYFRDEMTAPVAESLFPKMRLVTAPVPRDPAPDDGLRPDERRYEKAHAALHVELKAFISEVCAKGTPLLVYPHHPLVAAAMERSDALTAVVEGDMALIETRVSIEPEPVTRVRQRKPRHQKGDAGPRLP